MVSADSHKSETKEIGGDKAEESREIAIDSVLSAYRAKNDSIKARKAHQNTLAASLKHLVTTSKYFGIVLIAFLVVFTNTILLRPTSDTAITPLTSQAVEAVSSEELTENMQLEAVAQGIEDESDLSSVSGDLNTEVNSYPAAEIIESTNAANYIGIDPEGMWSYAEGIRYFVYPDNTVATGTIQLNGASVTFDDYGAWISTRIDVAYVSQLPDLPFGCEVVSSTMMLNHAGVQVTKGELVSGLNYSGDPNEGFTGSVTSVGRSGLGGIVWPKGILGLLQSYLESAHDMSGSPWDEIERYIDNGKPICMWITTPALDHTVVLTGYSADNVWINDPQVEKDVMMNKETFKAYWAANGYRALSY